MSGVISINVGAEGVFVFRCNKAGASFPSNDTHCLWKKMAEKTFSSNNEMNFQMALSLFKDNNQKLQSVTIIMSFARRVVERGNRNYDVISKVCG